MSQPFLHPNDEHWMHLALQQAKLARDAGEVPVGAVIVCDNQCIAAAYNTPIAGHDPTAHAEINALRQAAQTLQNYRLQGCTLYVTLEPCAMCAMAMLHARIERVVFGAWDIQTGAAGSVLNVLATPQFNHQVQMTGGVLQAACSALLKQFFQQKRIRSTVPLREDALRTPLACFTTSIESNDDSRDLLQLQTQGSWHSDWITDLPALAGLQMHYRYKPAAPPSAPDTRQPLLVCIHDENSFSEQYAQGAGTWTQSGWGVLMPDLIGFGRSDKPKKERWHTPDNHAAVLAELLTRLEPNTSLHIILPRSLIALLVLLSGYLTDKMVQVSVIEHLPALPKDLAQAPFPDEGHCAAPRAVRLWPQALPALLPLSPSCTVTMYESLEALPASPSNSAF